MPRRVLNERPASPGPVSGASIRVTEPTGLRVHALVIVILTQEDTAD